MIGVLLSSNLGVGIVSLKISRETRSRHPTRGRCGAGTVQNKHPTYLTSIVHRITNLSPALHTPVGLDGVDGPGLGVVADGEDAGDGGRGVAGLVRQGGQHHRHRGHARPGHEPGEGGGGALYGPIVVLHKGPSEGS